MTDPVDPVALRRLVERWRSMPNPVSPSQIDTCANELEALLAGSAVPSQKPIHRGDLTVLAKQIRAEKELGDAVDGLARFVTELRRLPAVPSQEDGK